MLTYLGDQQEEHRAINAKYYVPKDVTNQQYQGQSHGQTEESRGKKRARAEDLF